jgi:alpha-beta hydrolase superfamily lysophospholipase
VSTEPGSAQPSPSRAGAIAAPFTKAPGAKGPTRFAGLKPGWDTTPQMRAFLANNDAAVTPGFTLHRPTLIVQGSDDAFVHEQLTTAFVTRLKARGATVTYKR